MSGTHVCLCTLDRENIPLLSFLAMVSSILHLVSRLNIYVLRSLGIGPEISQSIKDIYVAANVRSRSTFSPMPFLMDIRFPSNGKKST